jgi:hypothetical protein
MTGAGKSAFTENLLWQTAAHFDYTLIAEEGLSYKRFTEALGETPDYRSSRLGADAQLPRHPAAAACRSSTWRRRWRSSPG